MAKDDKWDLVRIKRTTKGPVDIEVDGVVYSVYTGRVRHRRDKAFFGAQNKRALLRQMSSVVNDKIE